MSWEAKFLFGAGTESEVRIHFEFAAASLTAAIDRCSSELNQLSAAWELPGKLMWIAMVEDN